MDRQKSALPSAVVSLEAYRQAKRQKRPERPAAGEEDLRDITFHLLMAVKALKKIGH